MTCPPPSSHFEAVLNAETLEELNRQFSVATAAFGFQCYAIGRMAAPDAHGEFFLVTWPVAWTDLYAASGFAALDPAVAMARDTAEAFTWTELKRRRPGEGRSIFKAAATFGWTDGLVVPVHGPGVERGLVSLVTDKLALGDAARDAITGLSILAYKRARKFALARQRKTAILTPREREALHWVSKGYEDPGIASMMSISQITARNHVQRAKQRLGASTRAQAVAIAITSHLI